jgi:hypothetical protein
MKQSLTIPSLSSSDAEYVLYTFEPSNVDAQSVSWKKQSITHNRLSAMSAGQKLFNQGLYARIELYHRTKDNTSMRTALKPIHSWSSRGFMLQNDSLLMPRLLLLASGVCLMIALALTISMTL